MSRDIPSFFAAGGPLSPHLFQQPPTYLPRPGWLPLFLSFSPHAPGILSSSLTDVVVVVVVAKMRGHGILSRLFQLVVILTLIALVTAQDPTSSSGSNSQQPPPPTSASNSDNPQPTNSNSNSNPPPQSSSQGNGNGNGNSSGSSSGSPSPSTTRPSSSGGGGSMSRPPGETSPPDVHLRVPNLSVQRIELDVDNLRADVNLAAEIANIVTLNVGVQVGVEKVNITIADVAAQLELVIRLGRLVDIVNRTLATLDLNPLLINILNEVTDVVDSVVGAVDGLLGSILQGNSKLNFLIDNLGNIIQEVVGDAGSIVSSIVGNYQSNMTYTGVSKELGNGLTQKTYRYDALGSLVNIIFNTLGQVVQAVVVGKDNGQGGGGGGGGGGNGGGGSSSGSSSGTPSTTATTQASSSSNQQPTSTGG